MAKRPSSGTMVIGTGILLFVGKEYNVPGDYYNPKISILHDGKMVQVRFIIEARVSKDEFLEQEKYLHNHIDMAAINDPRINFYRIRFTEPTQ